MEHLLYLQFSLLQTITQYTFPEKKLNRKKGEGHKRKTNEYNLTQFFIYEAKSPEGQKSASEEKGNYF